MPVWTGKTREFTLMGRDVTFFNQRCRDWTHPYAWQGKGNLADSGCGVFALCHCAQWLTGRVLPPEPLADFSCRTGGRGDDGTDRPALLAAAMAHGLNTEMGFSYHGDGLRNELSLLFSHLAEERGVALCNLRVGHIVALVAAREREGLREVLAVDSYSESASEKVRDHVTEVIPGTEIRWPVRNEQGIIVGESLSYGAFWVSADTPRDFNLLYRLS